MNILEINRNTLANLYEQYKENFEGLSLDGNNLIYNGESIDISNFNINDLLTGDSMFTTSLSILSAEDIFRIIRLHAITINSKLKEKNKDNNLDKLAIIKRENPLMENVTIVKRNNGGYSEEFINIVDDDGKDHLFRNDRNLDFFTLYEVLRIKNFNHDITPNELIEEINRKLYDISLEDSRDISNRTTTNEDYLNKLNSTAKPYENDNKYRVFGSENDDLTIVARQDDPSRHEVVTYRDNEFGDLVIDSHKQNVSENEVVSQEETSQVQGSETSIGDDKDQQVIENKDERIAAILISSEEFYELLNSSVDLTKEQRRNVDLYYAYLGDLILYEDYLLPELQQILAQFRKYVYELEYSDEAIELNPKQKEAIDKNYQMEEQKVLEVRNESLEKKEEHVKKLVLKNPDDSQGSISTIQVIALVVGIAIILTAVTLYLIG